MTKTISKTKTITTIVLATALVGVAGFSAGIWYLGKVTDCPPCPACPDCSSCGAGSGEEKNVDLTVAQVKNMPSGGDVRDQLPPKVTIKNNGTDATGAFNVKFYWSKIYLYSSGKYKTSVPITKKGVNLLKTQRVEGLAAGQSMTIDFDSEVPDGSVYHAYYFPTWVVDADDEIKETDEENNLKCQGFFVL